MPKNWNTRKLGDIAEIIMGQSPKGSTTNNNGDGLPLLNGPTEFGYSSPTPTQFTIDPKKLSQEGDVLFCVRGSTTGRMNYANQIYAIGRGIGAFRGKNEYPTKYVKYILDNYLKRMLTLCTGSTFPNLSRTDLENFSVQACKPKEAEAIASILSAIDEKIENNLATNKTLEDMAMALYKHWFVDFGPFKEGKFVDSELGEIPEGWKATNMGEVTDLKQGLAINKKTNYLLCEKGEFSIPLFKIRDLINDTVEHYVKRDEVPKQCIAQKDDLIFTRTGQVGYVFRWKEGCVHNNCFKVIPNNKLEKEYLYQFLLNPVIKQLTNDIASGSVQKDLNHTSFKSIEIVLPPIDIQNKFRNIVFPLVTQQNENRIENQTLTQLRDTLLPKLISGEVRLKEFEEEINAAL